MRTLGLTERQRKFVAEYRGEGDGLRAARAAGFQGNDLTVKVSASRLLKHPGVKAALEEKFAKARPAPAVAGGKKTGSLIERIALLMAIGRDPKVHPRDRTKALLGAAELAGEKGRGRFDPLPLVPPAPEPTPPAEEPSGEDTPEVRMPARLLVVSGGRERG